MVTARVTMNRPSPVPLNLITPPEARFKKNHLLYWRRRPGTSIQEADSYNYCFTLNDKGCLRRWLEFTGSRVPHRLDYATIYKPVSVQGRPARWWVLCDSDMTELCCFTNAAEAWLVLLAMEQFGDRHCRLVYEG